MLCFPICKINLGLSITAKRTDGFHNIETVLYPIMLHDILEVTLAKQTETIFNTTGLNIKGGRKQNLVFKAYELLKNDFSLEPVNIHLHKVIPMGAGLGGGSADAAFDLKLLNNVFDLKLDSDQLQKYATELGSDCAFFIQSKPAIATGRGEILDFINLDLSNYHFVIIKPDILINTSEAYSWIQPSKKNESIKSIIQKPVERWKQELINDFEAPIFKQYPEIKNIKDQLYGLGAIYSSLTGSGSAVYGIFKNRPDLKGKFEKYFVWQDK